ncbi:MAG: sigma-54 dependent transcriptional regulator [Thermoguttaceae bacterium]|jgi:transcriptional regulator with GAF, ATPase, and Fis domain
MEEYQAVLLDVWREACRHIEITQSTETIAALLARHIPIDRILVRRVDGPRSCVETVAIGPGTADSLPDARTQCSPAQMERLLEWCRRGEVTHGGSPSGNPLETILPPPVMPAPVEADVLAGPLRLPGDRHGLLVVVAPRTAAFGPQHVQLVQVLLEPFSVALENDQRLAEVAALREAAEADKRSLLSRLGRQQLGDTIVGADSGLRAVMERVELVARSDVPVLIFGETGSGKEVVARSIHNRSARAQGPFIRVNCGAIPHELIDSQLFGHERGAFTGAVETRKGWFERADGGTLLLDELGELPPAAQVRLLRVLQDGWLDRVGGQRPIHVDVRIVAATHRDLAAMVAEGQFREDLWYRVAIFPIVLPGLRERREDIPDLARHFAQRAATRFGLYPAMPTPEDLDLLSAYPWPGNVRELATVIDRAAILGDGKRLEVAKALGTATSPAPAASPEAPAAPPASSPGIAPVEPSAIVPLEVAMRRHIEAALSATAGRIEGPRGAAKLLAINPHTLRARMRKLGIDWKHFRPAD